MISYISGKVIKNEIGKVNYMDILIPSGIGYRVFVTSQFKFVEKDTDVFVYTSFQVREDSQTLYGFNTELERDFFEQLLTVSGIGPKLGLSILSTYSMERVKELVLEGDSKMLSKVSGLGLKGAQKIILELRGKIDFDRDDINSKSDIRLKELKEALRSLGFTGSGLEESVKRGGELLKKENMDIEDLIRKVLVQ
ncbi:Holliday junction DNA helicase RuvA [candidate division WS6 bacterium RIFOXYD1_FULL_33_8]|uniref:Holliday junction branch migration complex subunit RuvA n=2 Tax=Candidatus Dojkabacteria TaxID=74243 RepID=A0A0G0AFC9_9BACT|nr:MAG: Holliday junction DNA helicase RuvA, holliday junction DNA helicase RuvA [candidate division WS6 bacterium GW2011_GWE2_33_157]KKP44661.1 MAG: Holliday junction DNA helicase RuvA, holliday junction DNA helicase RuvA [candidate division WS6 bacterium GW2011_GWC1_33_20]KKP45999.1 MAG: Holliday junction DNA helicase RuvA, holliday junction DNA helicase RuvA [candidate division WS6 bacterium GW2011_GWF1_33_233]KKP55489.1 MAG: Holliday junction ATP-dependent DNA helicase RuvA [candidate divisi